MMMLLRYSLRMNSMIPLSKCFSSTHLGSALSARQGMASRIFRIRRLMKVKRTLPRRGRNRPTTKSLSKPYLPNTTRSSISSLYS